MTVFFLFRKNEKFHVNNLLIENKPNISNFIMSFLKSNKVSICRLLKILDCPLRVNDNLKMFTIQVDDFTLTFTMRNWDISCFENCVDPDQLASQKPADQDLHCFHFTNISK